MPEISVIIPTYQHGETISRCLDSVFSQTIVTNRHREERSDAAILEGIASPACPAGRSSSNPRNDDILEVIVVDDGSTDDTEEAIKPYLGRITYHKIENSGAPKARNTGFALSRGRFVIFLDADITMKPEMLEELLGALKSHQDASYAYGGFRFGLAHFRPIAFDPQFLKRMNYIHTSALIRREDFPGFDESLKRFQDWDLWLTMLKSGKKGVAVKKTLFTAKERSKFGMSKWRPKIFFSPLLDILGIRPKTVGKYRAAAAVIAKKHDFQPFVPKLPTRYLWLAFLAVFAVSAACFNHPAASTVAALAMAALTVAVTRNRLLYGVVMMLAELVFGSLAGKSLAVFLPGFTVPLRFVIFVAVGSFWLLRMTQGRVRIPPRNIAMGVLLTLMAAGLGVANGLMHGIPLRDVFFDANAYLALPMILFFASAVENDDDQKRLLACLKHGVIALSVLTLAALYFFGHRFPNVAGVFAYKWLRDSRIAEITALGGGTYRVFIQSQIFCLLVFLWVVLKEREGGWIRWLWGILPASALLISGSRSFAVGIGAAFIVWVTMILSSPRRRACLPDRQGPNLDWIPAFARMTVARTAFFVVAAVAVYATIMLFPIPPARSQASFQDMLRSRSVSDRDAATASRWKLLPELNKKIMQSPIIGNGFGTSVTYESSDPRIISATGGTYTTSAFEWNYHDILVKMGLAGLIAYGFLLWSIFAVLLKAEPRARLWLIPAFFALLATNILSPYLNHPLGIGYLALLLALAQRKPDTALKAEALVRERAPSAAVASSYGVTISA